MNPGKGGKREERESFVFPTTGLKLKIVAFIFGKVKKICSTIFLRQHEDIRLIPMLVAAGLGGEKSYSFW